ncbi:hypothetical protein [Hyphomicrobium sp. 99]|uniref:hypothetical protein n=1 Tax=Hyphomicrobium sp. 99 TaxID=1163419 RepID=UPI0005F825BF|nr:hypothetical protein [Hyphomicrobium sp. 99]
MPAVIYLGGAFENASETASLSSVPTLPTAKNVDLLGDFNRVIDLDAEIAHGALELRMTAQQLDRPKVAGSMPSADW